MNYWRLAGVWVGIVGLLVLITAFLMGCEVAYCAEWQDLSLVHKTLIAEAGGEGIEGMVAVANVIRNRARLRGLTFEQVVLQKWQFSCLNYGKARLEPFILKNRAVWDDALTAWQVSANEDITGMADHYHTKSVNPSWNRGMKQTAVIGRHRFFKS